MYKLQNLVLYEYSEYLTKNTNLRRKICNNNLYQLYKYLYIVYVLNHRLHTPMYLQSQWLRKYYFLVSLEFVINKLTVIE